MHATFVAQESDDKTDRLATGTQRGLGFGEKRSLQAQRTCKLCLFVYVSSARTHDGTIAVHGVILGQL